MKRWYPWIGFGVVILIVSLLAVRWVLADNTRKTSDTPAVVAAVTPTPPRASSVDSMQQKLFDPRLDVPSRESLMAKIELQKKADAERDSGYNNRALKNPAAAADLPQSSKAMVLAEDSAGIYEGSDAMVKPDKAQINNYWQGKIGDRDVVVLAGAAPDDASQGLVVMITAGSGDQNGGYEYFLAPEKNGSLRITSFNGSQIVMQTSNGAQIVFDVSQKAYVQ